MLDVRDAEKNAQRRCKRPWPTGLAEGSESGGCRVICQGEPAKPRHNLDGWIRDKSSLELMDDQRNDVCDRQEQKKNALLVCWFLSWTIQGSKKS